MPQRNADGEKTAAAFYTGFAKTNSHESYASGKEVAELAHQQGKLK